MLRERPGMPARYLFSTVLDVRVGDTGFGGGLPARSLTAFIDEARLRFLKHYHYNEHDIEGLGLVTVDSRVVYRAGAFHGDYLQIEVSVGNFNRFGCDFFYLVSNRDTAVVVAEACCSAVFFDYQQGKTVSVPASFRETFIKDV
ncbi:thioesterase family protein [Granulosicoccaceae sp. 1_MG-2023]|nr:thioesterase family protein [Granulosicoccaceae sp. 1_MG-2023]